MDRVKNLTPILIFIAVLTFLSVGFAVYKAVTAFSGTVESPRYDAQSPIKDIGAVPFKLSRLDGQTQPPRLDDSRMFFAYSGSQEIADVISQGESAAPSLEGVFTSLGMSTTRAQATARKIVNGWPSGIEIAGKVAISEPELTVSSDYLVVNDFFDYGQGGSLNTADLEISWVIRGGEPALDGVLLTW